MTPIEDSVQAPTSLALTALSGSASVRVAATMKGFATTMSVPVFVMPAP